jgi:Bifunctional DNA primase/polymerase, N-terminal/Primase C terminal 2 (PriCT-2)
MNVEPAEKAAPAKNRMLKAALQYAVKKKWHVFPLHWVRKDGTCSCGNLDCGPNAGKHPLPKLAPQGFKNATTDAAQIRKWWTRFPRANIGIATGASNLLVIDIDMKGDKNGLASLNELGNRLGPLSDTKSAVTPSGGLHFFFQNVEGVGSSSGKLGSGLDVRASGGYVVGAPSSNGKYCWKSNVKVAELPSKWIEHLRKLSGRTAGEPSAERDRQADPELVAKALAVIPNPPELGYSDWKKIGLATWAATGGSALGFECFDGWSSRWVKYSADDTRKAWAEITRSPPNQIGAGTLFYLADQANPDWRGSEKSEKPSAAVMLARIAAEAHSDDGRALFHNADGQGYADLIVNGHRETHPVRSQSYKQWLVREFYQSSGKAPSSEALSTALNLIEAQALFEGARREVNLRVAQRRDTYYLDLCNDKWQAVEIDAEGWRVVDRPPVRFIRRKGMRSLPKPVKGASVGLLRKYVNIKNDADFRLILAWLVAALRPVGPYPVLTVTGRAGTGKTTLCKLLHDLIDPSLTKEGRAPPRDSRDLSIAANNSFVVHFDNLSDLPGWMSDMLARLATGGGFATRQLYTDEEEKIFRGVRPVVLNGIENFITRGDLASRSIFITLPQIKDKARQSERTLLPAFEKDKGAILGALLDVVVHGLRELPNVKSEPWPRMADFAEWLTACETALWPQGTIRKDYGDNRLNASVDVVEADRLATVVRTFMERVQEWEGELRTLLDLLNDLVTDEQRRERNWPKAAHTLSGKLQRLAPDLRMVGVHITGPYHDPKTLRSMIKLRLVDPTMSRQKPSKPSEASKPNKNGHFSAKASSPKPSEMTSKPSERNPRAERQKASKPSHPSKAFAKKPLQNGHFEGSKAPKAPAGSSSRFKYRPNEDARRKRGAGRSPRLH